MIVFINGKNGGWAPPAGKPYWTEPETPFVAQAQEYLKDVVIWFPAIKHASLSHAADRYALGYLFCRENMREIASRVKTGDTVKFIAHSMGCSFAEGMAAYLIEQGYTVTTMIHINAFQAGEMIANSNIPYTLDYQYTDDVIIRIPFISCVGDISGAVKVREKSHLNLRRRHRGPVYPRSADFWHSVISSGISFRS